MADPRLTVARERAYRWAGAVAVVAGVVVFLAGLFGRQIDIDPTNVPLISSDGRFYYAAAAILTAVFAWTVARSEPDRELVGRVHFRSETGEPTYPQGATGWIVPAVALLTAFLHMARYFDWVWLVLAATTTGATVFLACAARHHNLRAEGIPGRNVRLGRLALANFVAFVSFATVYGFKTRTLFSGTVILLLAWLLLFQLLDDGTSSRFQRDIYSAAGAIIVAEFCWALNYWNASPWQAGVMLLIVFQVFAGLALAHIRCQLNQRALIQHAGIGATVFLVVAYFVG
jgi:hypothetical protein